MPNKKVAFLLKKVPLSLLSLGMLITSGCLLKKEVIPEYFPEVSTKQEKQQVTKEIKKPSPLAEALSEIKITTKEETLSQSKAKTQTQKKAH